MRISNRIKRLIKSVFFLPLLIFNGLKEIGNKRKSKKAVITLKQKVEHVKIKSLGNITPIDLDSNSGGRYSINIITPSTNIHGGTKRLLTICKLLKQRGHHVKLIRQHTSRKLDWFDFKVPILDIRFNENTEIEFLEEKFPNGDILMTYGNCKANKLIAQLSPKKGIKTALFMHFGVHDNELDISNAKLKEFKILATTSWIADEIKKSCGRDSEIVDFGVHTDQFYPVKPQSDQLTIGALYHKDEWKRSKDVIEAIEMLNSNYTVKLILFGQVENPELPDSITYYYNPNQDDLRQIYSNCHIWVTPSIYEGIGMCSVEAMLCKAHLITVDTGGSRDFCSTENSTILKNKKSPIDIKEAIIELINNPDLAARKIEEAYKTILDHSWSNSISLFEKHFDSYVLNLNPIGFRSLDYELTIGIPIHNELSFVKNCIESIKRNTASPFQLILVDDVSDDETRKYLTTISQASNVKYIRNFERRGFPFNCNEIIRHSNGKYICLLNSDTLVTKNWDVHLINALKSNSKLGMVGPSTSYGVAKNYESIAQQLEAVHFRRFDMSMEEIEEFSHILYEREEGNIEYTEYLNGFCMLFDRSVISQIGFLDTKFGLGSREEVQFVDRLRMAGYDMGWVKYSYVHHYGHRSFTNYEDSKSLWEKNKELYFRDKGKELQIGITDKRIGIVYNAKFSSSTRKRTFEIHKYLKEYINIELIHWPRLSEETIRLIDVILIQRIGGLNEKIDNNFLKKIVEWKKKYPEKTFIYDLDDYIISSQNDLPLKLIKICDRVIASTSSLKKSLKKYNDNISVLENGVDYERFLYVKSDSEKSDELKIVCFSLAAAGIDMLERLGDLLNNGDRRFSIILYSGEEIDKSSLKYVDVRKNISLDDMFKELKNSDYLINWGEHGNEYFDKLTEQYSFKNSHKNTFVDSKSALKYYNAGISKTVLLTTKKPLAYSEIVRHEETGFFIESATDAHQVIVKLEHDLALKDKILNSAYQDTITHFSLNATSLQYLNYFISLP